MWIQAGRKRDDDNDGNFIYRYVGEHRLFLADGEDGCGVEERGNGVNKRRCPLLDAFFKQIRYSLNILLKPLA